MTQARAGANGAGVGADRPGRGQNPSKDFGKTFRKVLRPDAPGQNSVNWSPARAGGWNKSQRKGGSPSSSPRRLRARSARR